MKIYPISNSISAIWFPVSMRLLYAKTEMLESETFLSMLNEEHCLEQSIFESRTEVASKRPIRTLYLCTSYNCNLSCDYCLTKKSIAKNREPCLRLSDEMAESVLRFFISCSEKDAEKEVVLYGGEPLLYPDLVKFVFNKTRELERKMHHSKPSRFIICTNGTLITKRIASFVSKANIYPVVSFDGMEQQHNRHRKNNKGEGSFECAAKGYDNLVAEGIRPGVSLTLGCHTSEEIVETVIQINDRFKPATLATNLIVSFESEANPFVVEATEFDSRMWDLFEECRHHGIYIVKNIMDNRVRPFVEKEPRYWGCTGMGARIGVLPDGRFVPCMALTHKYAHSWSSESTINDYCPDILLNGSPYKRKECKNCEAISVCGGGCPAATYLGKKSISANIAHCNTSRLFLNNMIRLLWDLCSDKATAQIELDGYFSPSLEDRKIIYGNIVVDNKSLDFQYSPLSY
jgi:radical SAM protein with 4Fe4S-binding SPASM domain